MRARHAAALGLLSFPLLASALDPLEPLKRVAIPKPAFVAACKRVYREAREDVRKHPGTVVPLAPAQREQLLRWFPEAQVNRTRFHYGATTPRITILGIAIIDRPAAITFFDDVYLKRAAEPSSDGQLALLAHELTHVAQYEKKDFSDRYCGALYDADFRDRSNAYEKAAYAVQKAFGEFLASLRPKTVATAKP